MRRFSSDALYVFLGPLAHLLLQGPITIFGHPIWNQLSVQLTSSGACTFWDWPEARLVNLIPNWWNSRPVWSQKAQSSIQGQKIEAQACGPVSLSALHSITGMRFFFEMGPKPVGWFQSLSVLLEVEIQY